MINEKWMNEKTSITAWRGCDRRAADAAINLNYNVLWFTVNDWRNESKNDSIGMLKVSYNETKIQKFSINEKNWKEKAVKLP